MKSNLKVLGLVIASAMLTPAISAHEDHAHLAPWEEATVWPDRIVVNPGEDPSTSFSVTWRAHASVSSAIAEFVEASGDSRFDTAATSFNAKIEQVNLEKIRTAYDRIGTANYGRGMINQFSVTFKNLKPNTLYAYRVRGARGHWSEWYQTRTAPATGRVSFLYFGDAQYGIRSHASRIFRQALLENPRANFIIHAGDLVNKGERDTEWAEWYAAKGFITGMIPIIPVAGNHEYLSTKEGGSKDGKAVLTDLWRPQFTLPIENALPAPLHETVFDLRYGDNVHVFVLDSSSPLWQQQMDWLRTKATASTADWKIVALHHSPFRPGIQGYANNPQRGDWHRDRQQAFLNAIENVGIDLVLAGHNHSYTRANLGTGALPGLPKVEARTLVGGEQKVETVVVVSISGAMSGNMTMEHFGKNEAKFGQTLALQRLANNTPTYQTISIDGDRLEYRSFIATGVLYDGFTLVGTGDAPNALVNHPVVGTTNRQFNNTGPYSDKNDLR